MRPPLVTRAAIAAFVLALVAPPAPAEVSWTRVGTGITQGVSGIAPTASGWVIVRDNKSNGQNRVALLGDDHVVRNLTWPGSAPSDLEAIDAIPGQPGRYAVVTSSGSGRVIRISGTSMAVVRSFTLPAGRVENESFAMTRFGSTAVAVWGNRGSSGTPGRLFAATFNVSRGTFGSVVHADVTVPYPTSGLRPVADAKVLSGGRIVISSASDLGNNGPFASAVYDVGTVRLASGRAQFALTPPVSLGTYAGHKVEAIGCKGSTGLLGTDDENLGGWTASADVCG